MVEFGDAAAARVVSPAPVSAGRRRGNRRLLVAILIFDSLVLAWFALVEPSNAIYSRGVTQVLRDADRWAFRHVRVDGVLVSGTLRRLRNGCEFRFLIRDQASVGGETLNVIYRPEAQYGTCSLPVTPCYAPGIDVPIVAEGWLEAHEAAPPSLLARIVMTKCSGYYPVGGKRFTGLRRRHPRRSDR